MAYGSFANAEEAKQKFAQLNLTLPQSIQPQPQSISSYATYVNDLGSDELKSSTSQLYAINLRPAALPRVDEITVDVDGTKQARYFEQAEYGKYTRAALLGLILNENGF